MKMTSNGRKRALAIAILSTPALVPTLTRADDYLWNVVPPTSATTLNDWNASPQNWTNTTTATFPAPTYPGTVSTDNATLKDDLPSPWSLAASTPINVNVAGVVLNTLTIEDNVANAAFQFNVNNDMQVTTFNAKNDGARRNQFTIANTKTLTANTINLTGDYQVQFNSIGTGKIKWMPVSNTATFKYMPWNDGDRLDVNQDFSDAGLSTMNVQANTPGATKNIEAQSLIWTVGNATAGTQTWTSIDSAGAAAQLTLQSRSNGSVWNFDKPNGNDVDMGKRTTGVISGGFRINRANLNNNPTAPGLSRLFSTSSGGQAGGNVRIADYVLNQMYNNVAGAGAYYDTVGANLTITDGGSVTLQDFNTSPFDDVNSLRVLPTNTVKALGPTGGNISVIDSSPTSVGRMGIYFAGATLDARGNLSISGPATYLNDGTGSGDANAGGTIKVGGNVAVSSASPSGFSAITTLPGGATQAFDDFDLRKTSLTMDGGGTKSLDWNVGAANTGTGMTAADFSNLGGGTAPVNFTLGTLNLTNNTLVNYQPRELYLDGDTTGGLNIDLGSVLNFTGGHIYILDPNNSEYARLQTYPFGRILGGQVLLIPGVGELITVPEPGSMAALLGLAAVGLRRRRR